MKRIWMMTLWTFTLLLLGCGDTVHRDPKSDIVDLGELDELPEGGQAQMTVSVSKEFGMEQWGFAQFLDALKPKDFKLPMTRYFPTDTCINPLNVSNTDLGLPEYEQGSGRALDAGASVTLTAGSNSLTLPHTDEWYESNYMPAPADAAEREYDLTVAGGADLESGRLGAIAIPAFVDLTSPDLDGTWNRENAVFEWTPGQDRIITITIAWGASVDTFYMCRARDDGSFRIPAEIMDQIVATTTEPAFVSVRAERYDGVELDGNRLTLIGIAEAYGNFILE